MPKKYEIRIDVTDDVELVQQGEYEAKTTDDLIGYRLQGMKPYTVAKIAVGNRALGFANEDIMPPDKICYHVGVIRSIHSYETAQKRKAQINGKEYEVREFIASVDDHDNRDTQNESELESVHDFGDTRGSSDTLILSTDPATLQRAIAYLETVVPGYIWGRLILIAEHGGDVRAEGDKLCSEIDEMVKRLEPIST